MAIREILQHPNVILYKPAEPVTKFNGALRRLMEDMYDTMIEQDGVGLAAPQIGVTQRVAIVDIGEESGVIDLINPEVIEQSGNESGIEGCLSFKDLYGDVDRPTYAKIKAQNRKGKTFTIEVKGFLARACLHEIDHLNGEVFTSKVSKYYTTEELEQLTEVEE